MVFIKKTIMFLIGLTQTVIAIPLVGLWLLTWGLESLSESIAEGIVDELCLD